MIAPAAGPGMVPRALVWDQDVPLYRRYYMDRLSLRIIVAQVWIRRTYRRIT
jgi:hypothetical protein